MSVDQYPLENHLEIILNAEVCAKKLEGNHGIYAAPIAEFISHAYHQSGEEKLSQYWKQIVSLMRIREDERLKELI